MSADSSMISDVTMAVAQASQGRTCKRHQGKPLELFCKRCDLTCCSQCVNDHYGHFMETIQVVAKRNRQMLNDKLAAISPPELKGQLENIGSVLEAGNQKFEMHQRKVNQRAKSLQEEVELRQKELLRDLNEAKHRYAVPLRYGEMQAKDHLDAIAELENKIAEQSDEDMVTNVATLKAQIIETTEKITRWHFEEPSINLEYKFKDDPTAIKHLVGDVLTTNTSLNNLYIPLGFASLIVFGFLLVKQFT